MKLIFPSQFIYLLFNKGWSGVHDHLPQVLSVSEEVSPLSPEKKLHIGERKNHQPLIQKIMQKLIWAAAEVHEKDCLTQVLRSHFQTYAAPRTSLFLKNYHLSPLALFPQVILPFTPSKRAVSPPQIFKRQ